jgi:hypothetical protein
MIVLYVVDSSTKEETLKNMNHALKKRKLKQEFVLLYCLDTHKVLKFTRHGTVYSATGAIKATGKAGLSTGKSIKRELVSPHCMTPVLTRRVMNLPQEALSPSRNLPENVFFPLPTVSQQLQTPDDTPPPSPTQRRYEQTSSHSSEEALDDIVDSRNTHLVFYNDDKEISTLYSCFYYKNQLIAVRPELYERVKQEFDLNQIIYVAELFGIKEITITKTNIKDRGVTAGASVEANGLTQSLSLERTDYLNENKTMRLTYDLAKSKYIFYTMKDCTSLLAQLSQSDIEELPLAYGDITRNPDLYRLISARLEANMSTYDIDLKSVRKQSYGITLDAAYLAKCGFKIAKHEMHFNHLKVKLVYYNTDELIMSSNLLLNRKCFEMIANHTNLLNAYLENFLLLTAPREFIKYKILKQIDPVKHAEILSRVKAFSDLDITTGSLTEALRGLSATTMIKCDEEGLTKIQELYPYIYNFKRDPRLIDPTHDKCYSMRCTNPKCKSFHLKTVQTWIIRVYNLHNDHMLMVNRHNTKKFYDCIYRIIINLRHIPNYEKFVKFVSDELAPYTKEIDKEKAMDKLEDEGGTEV